MKRKGQYLGAAIKIAASHYSVSYEEVQKGLASRAGKARAGKKLPPKPVMICENDDREAVWHCRINYGYDYHLDYYMCAECGKVFPAHHEGGETPSSVKWTAYKPSKAVKS